MNTDKYIIDKLMSDLTISSLMSYMKTHGGCYIAGGAMTCIATGRHEEINDFDVYFPSKEACAEAIRWMKEGNPHVAYISSKSITYAYEEDPNIQFVYNRYYDKATDIFDTFDFTINMSAYDCVTGQLYFDDDFWLHNSQRFLSFNSGTSFPIISLLRVAKYMDRGYHTSRNEMLKISLAINSLKITSWKEAMDQLGNSYGLDLAQFDESVNFSIPALLDCIGKVQDVPGMPVIQDLLYPYDAVDFFVLGEPIKYIRLNGKEYLLEKDGQDCEATLEKAVDEGKLGKTLIAKEDFLGQTFYFASSKDNLRSGDVVKAKYNQFAITRENLSAYDMDGEDTVYEVSFQEADISSVTPERVKADQVKVLCRVFRGFDLPAFLAGKDVPCLHNARMAHYGTAEGGDKAPVPDAVKQHIRDCVRITGGNSCYARNTFRGVVLEGGEDITPEQILLYADDYNLCFGGSIRVEEDGNFRGEYYTD